MSFAKHALNFSFSLGKKGGQERKKKGGVGVFMKSEISKISIIILEWKREKKKIICSGEMF